MSTVSGTNDELIQRFLDGELEADQYLEARDLIERDESARARYEQLREVNELVAGYNRGVLSEPVPERFNAVTERRAGFDLYRIAASVLLVGIGVLIGWALNGGLEKTAGDRLVERAVAAHEVYAREVLHAVEIAGEDRAHLGKWLSKRLGVEVTIPDLARFDYALLGGRLLPGAGRSANAMLVYEKPGGHRVSVYIMRSARPGHTNTLYVRDAGLDVFYWRDVELSCAVVSAEGGAPDRETLRVLSEEVYRQIEL